MQYRTFLQYLLLILATLLSYEAMVAALSLMNRPSDLLFYSGVALLAVTGAVYVAVVRFVWRRL